MDGLEKLNSVLRFYRENGEVMGLREYIDPIVLIKSLSNMQRETLAELHPYQGQSAQEYGWGTRDEDILLVAQSLAYFLHAEEDETKLKAKLLDYGLDTSLRMELLNPRKQ